MQYSKVGLGSIVPLISDRKTRSQAYRFFEHLKFVSKNLQRLAQKHVDGEKLDEKDIAWVNGMVSKETVNRVCVEITKHGGWFYDLYWREDDKAVSEHDRIVTPIHTQPSDDQGTIVGNVLHLGTGKLNPVIVIADNFDKGNNNKGVMHVGITQSAQRLVTKNFLRLNDQEWVTEHLAKSTRVFPQNVVSSSNKGRLWPEKCSRQMN